MTAPLVNISNLSVTYRGSEQAALDAINLSMGFGERLAIIGESGSGKSTLGLALAGLLPTDARISGSLVWPDLAQPQPGRDIGMVFQDPGNSLNPVLRIGEQIAEVAQRHLGMNWRQARERALELLGRVRIPQPERAIDAYPHQLSGGQRQRVAIASAIAAKPKLLIADEPTSALDMVVQSEIVALLDELVRADGMTLLFITHDMALASGFADRIAVFRNGALVETGPAQSVLGNPQTDYTATLIASHIDLTSPPLIGVAS
ncbi:ABC transporter ATP-binding protein [Devosia sp. 2618]|uniref:ABC transporter ATP-binding protein n=1 Tax=Devosia sp. 2618 TaxID=3156454 RepID=UPI003394A565